MKERVGSLLTELSGFEPAEVLRYLADHFTASVFSTSFGKEDQVIMHLLAGLKAEKGVLPISVFTLDTGRLFEETYDVFHRTRQKYGIEIRTYFPNQEAVQELLDRKGPLSFFESVENRKECCRIRKIEPLKRALKGNEIWITGLRRQQSENRSEMKMVEWDEANAIIKVHPLFEWTEQQVDEFVATNPVPVNALHRKGYPSIGCAPCTRAVEPGEDFRAGRWWWETSKKECGLHS